MIYIHPQVIKSILTVFVAATAFISAAQKAVIHNDLFFDQLKGPVKSAKSIPYTVNKEGKKGPRDSCCISLLEYDRHGFRTLEQNQDPATKDVNAQVYTKRFPNGHAQEIEFRINGKLVSTLISTLDEKGAYDKANNFDSAGKLISYFADVKVNEYGKVISLHEFARDSTLLRTILNEYAREIWIGGLIRDGKNREIYSVKLKLDESGKPIELTENIMHDNTLVPAIIKYRYDRFDEKGNWIERRELDESGKLRKIVERQIEYWKHPAPEK